MASVSVCIPTFNRKYYLKEAIESVLAQTYKDYEIIVVDDGSTDGTKQTLKDAGYRIKYHWQQNKGDSAARNKLMELASGQYITFLDSDDLLMPDAVARMIKLIEAEGGEVIVYGPYLRIDQNGSVYGRCKRKLYSGHITQYLFQNIFVHSCGSMFPKRVLQEEGGFDESLTVCSDYDLWLRLSLKYRFIALPEPTFKRRRHPGNLSTGSLQNRLAELQMLERFYYEKGGNKVIPKKIARRRLSTQACRAGKSAVRERNYKTACELFSQSFHQYSNTKSLIYWSGAILGRYLKL